VIVVVPAVKPVASPCELIVAWAGEDEVQTTTADTSCVVESLSVAVAVNCFVVSGAIVEFAGVIAIETRLAPVTVSEAVPLIEPEVAVIVAVPTPTPVANPLEVMVAEFDELLQVTFCSSCVLPSSKLPVAVNC
jgi:hypothetical protein